jgi:hypothetical protein
MEPIQMTTPNAKPRFLPNRKTAWKLFTALTLLCSSVTAVVITKGGARTPDQGVNNAFIAAGGLSRDLAVNGGYIYWVWRSSQDPTSDGTVVQTRGIGRAKIDGTEVQPNFIKIPSSNEPFGGLPGGIASDGTYLYWTIRSDDSTPNRIIRATLAGVVDPNAIAIGGFDPIGIAVSGGKLYWADRGKDAAEPGSIGRANVDGTGIENKFIPSAFRPYGIEVAGSTIYWASFPIVGQGIIGKANLDGSGANNDAIPGRPDATSGITGITSDGTYLYWALYRDSVSGTASSIGRMKLDGTELNTSYLQGLSTGPVLSPVGLAVTSTNLYWTSFEPKTIGRTEFDTDAPVLTVAPVAAVATALNSPITYSVPVTATDVNDDAANITITCDKGTTATGGTFPVGVTTVACAAKDAVGNTSQTKVFDVTVTKPTAPVLNLPASQSVVATGPTGAVVSYVAATSPSGTPTCTPASGSLFPIGNTSVGCTVTDAFEQTTTGTFQISVGLPGGPKPAVPADQIVTATSPAGAKVDYPAATSPAGPVTCNPVSGSTFVIGTTTVTCSVTDAFLQVGTASFKVTVNKPALPVIKVPVLVEVFTEATSAVAKFETPTSAAGTPTCSAVSGSVFPAGTTTVTCKVTDGFGQVGNASFQVVVRPPFVIPIIQVLPDTTTTAAPATTAPPTTVPPTTVTTLAPTATAAPSAAPTTVASTPQVEVAGVSVTPPEEAPAATPVNLEPSFAG